MSAPGFDDASIVINASTSSTTYAFSSVKNTGKHNKVCVFIKSAFDLGTSAEYKFQQSQTEDPAGDWYSLPIVNYSTLTTSTDLPPEYYFTAKAFTIQHTQSAAATLLGPYEVTIAMPYFRVAYKLTGAGTLTSTVTLTRIIV